MNNRKLLYIYYYVNGKKPGKPLFHGQSGKQIIMILMPI